MLQGDGFCIEQLISFLCFIKTHKHFKFKILSSNYYFPT